MIEKLTTKNFNLLLPLVAKYQEFYNATDIDEQINRIHFYRFAEDDARGVIHLYMADNLAVGFSTIYFNYSSVLPGEVGVLNDLFVLPEYRGKGYGAKLIEHAVDQIKQRGIKRLQWLTMKSNEQAQKLYDRLPASTSDWVLYTLNTEGLQL